METVMHAKEWFEYGILGVIALSFVAYVWWNARNTAKVLDKKDEYIIRLNDKREETAEKFQKTVDELTQQIKDLLQMLDRRTPT